MKQLNIEATENNDKNVLKSVLDFVHDIPVGKWKLELKKQTRSNRQNRTMHLLFSQIASALNNEGQSFSYKGFMGGEIEIPWNGELIKNFLWRPIQRQITGKESTAKLTTQEVDKIFVPINKFFGEMGIEVKFPCDFEKYLEQIKCQD